MKIIDSFEKLVEQFYKFKNIKSIKNGEIIKIIKAYPSRLFDALKLIYENDMHLESICINIPLQIADNFDAVKKFYDANPDNEIRKELLFSLLFTSIYLNSNEIEEFVYKKLLEDNFDDKTIEKILKELRLYYKPNSNRISDFIKILRKYNFIKKNSLSMIILKIITLIDDKTEKEFSEIIKEIISTIDINSSKYFQLLNTTFLLKTFVNNKILDLIMGNDIFKVINKIKDSIESEELKIYFEKIEQIINYNFRNKNKDLSSLANIFIDLNNYFDSEIKKIKNHFYNDWLGFFILYKTLVEFLKENYFLKFCDSFNEANFDENLSFEIMVCYHLIYYFNLYEILRELNSNTLDQILLNNINTKEKAEKIEDDIKFIIENYIFYTEHKSKYFNFFWVKYLNDTYSSEMLKDKLEKYIRSLNLTEKKDVLRYLKTIYIANYFAISLDKEIIELCKPEEISNYFLLREEKELDIENFIDNLMVYLLKERNYDFIFNIISNFIFKNIPIYIFNYFMVIEDDKIKNFLINNHKILYENNLELFYKLIKYYLAVEFLPILEEYQSKKSSINLKNLLFYLKLYNNLIEFNKDYDYDKLIFERLYHYVRINKQIELPLICRHCGKEDFYKVDSITEIIGRNIISSFKYKCNYCNKYATLYIPYTDFNENYVELYKNIIYKILREHNYDDEFKNLLKIFSELNFPYIGSVKTFTEFEEKKNSVHLPFLNERVLEAYWNILTYNYSYFLAFEDTLEKIPIVEIFIGLVFYYDVNNENAKIEKILNLLYRLLQKKSDFICALRETKDGQFILKSFNSFVRMYIFSQKLRIPDSKCYCGSKKKFQNCCFNDENEIE